MSRESYLQKVDNWNEFSPSGEYRTFRELFKELLDIAYPQAKATWTDMITDINKDILNNVFNGKRYFVDDAEGNGVNKTFYNYVPGYGIAMEASVISTPNESGLF